MLIAHAALLRNCGSSPWVLRVLWFRCLCFMAEAPTEIKAAEAPRLREVLAEVLAAVWASALLPVAEWRRLCARAVAAPFWRRRAAAGRLLALGASCSSRSRWRR